MIGKFRYFLVLLFILLFNLVHSQLWGYAYRIPITIQENSGNNLQDYQVKIVVNTQQLISQGMMRSDCGDIRFTYVNSTGEYLIPYWIESGCNTTNTTIWVKVPYIPANSNVTIYMYFGNPNATSLSNGSAVFEFFDDFLGTSLDTTKWVLGYETCSGASVTVSNGLALIKSSVAGTWQAIHSTYTISNTSTAVVEAKIQILSTDQSPHVFYLVSSDNADSARFGLQEDGTTTIGANTIRVQYKISGAYYYSSGLYNVGNNWFIGRIIKNGVYSFVGCLYDLNYNQLGSCFSYSSTVWANYNWWINVWVRDTTGFYWDWVRVRKYASVEPTFYLGPLEQVIFMQIISPQNTTYTTSTIPVIINISSSINTSANITLILNNTILFTEQLNITPPYIIYQKQLNLKSGIYNLTVVLSNNNTYTSSVFFSVDIDPPNIQVIQPQSYNRISYTNPYLPIIANVTDNFGVKSCTAYFLNNQYPCNTTVYVGNLPEGYYNITFIATDINNLTSQQTITLYIDFSQGIFVYEFVNYPQTIPAIPFNITTRVTCQNDWCDYLNLTLITPPQCSVLNGISKVFTSLDIFQSVDVVFTVYCKKATQYNFTLLGSLANNYTSQYQFTSYPPKFDIYITPPNPNATDTVNFIISLNGYQRPVSVYYRIVRYLPGYGTISDISSITNLTDGNNTVYSITNPNAGEILYFFANITDPIDFYESKNITTYVQDNIPPTINLITQKYNVVSYLIPQNVTFEVSDNVAIRKVELLIFPNITLVKYYNTSYVKDYFLIDNRNFVNQTVVYLLRVYDYYNNSVISNIYNYTVLYDYPPVIYNIQPQNNSIFNINRIPFSFFIYDDLSPEITCYINNMIYNTTNDSLVTLPLTLTKVLYTVNVTCIDNVNQTTTYILTYYFDNIPPTLDYIDYKTTDNILTIYMNVSDNLLLNDISIIVFSNNTTVFNQTFPISGNKYAFIQNITLPIGFSQIFINITDKAGNILQLLPISFLVTQKPTLTPTATPVISVYTPPKIIIRNYELLYNVTRIFFIIYSPYEYVSCTIFANDKPTYIGDVKTNNETFYDMKLLEGLNRVYISCIDKDGLQGISNTILINVTYVPKPTETLINKVGAMITKPEVTSPIGLGIMLTVLSVVFKSGILLQFGIPIAVGGPFIVSGIQTGDLGLTFLGTTISILIWLVIDILRRKLLIFS